MKIKRINEFENINEGILSSLISGVGNLFSSKKSKIDKIIKKIRSSREEEHKELGDIEKDIQNLNNDGTPEYRLSLSNLNRKAKIFSGMKDQEIHYLKKEASDLIEEDPKTASYFASELSKIEADHMRSMIDIYKKTRNESDLENFYTEFDRLTKNAEIKSRAYSNMEEYDPYENIEDFNEVIRSAPKEIVDLIELRSQDLQDLLKSMSRDELEKLSKDIRDFLFSLEIKYDSINNSIKSQIRKARREQDSSLLRDLEREEIKIAYHLKKPIDRIRYKRNILDKEIKNRGYAIA
jgi:hypothetical protein